MSPAAAILIVDFWLIRKTKWNIPELYTPGGIYWFTGGVNWRAFVAYFLGMWPALPGFVNAVSGLEVAVTWRRFYQISFFFGYVVSGTLYFTFCKLSPPPGLGIQVDFDVDGNVVVDGVGSESEKDVVEEGKGVEETKTEVFV